MNTEGVSHWPAITKWTNDFLRNQFGSNMVHVKVTPDGQFEGCEGIHLWEGAVALWR